MTRYTIKGSNNLLEKILEKMNEIVSHLRNMDESSEKYYILLKNYDQFMIDYFKIADYKMEIQKNTMPGLTIEREVEIIRKRIDEIIFLVKNNKINSENIKSTLERINLLESKLQNIRNR